MAISNTPEYIMNRVEIIPFSGCWIWMRSLDRYGYGGSVLRGEYRIIHRLSYELFVGKIPVGLTLDHLCRVRCCVNPYHLEPVSQAENKRRAHDFERLHSIDTHCHSGHERNKENKYVAKDGSIACRICNNNSSKKYHERKRREANVPIRKRKSWN